MPLSSLHHSKLLQLLFQCWPQPRPAPKEGSWESPGLCYPTHTCLSSCPTSSQPEGDWAGPMYSILLPLMFQTQSLPKMNHHDLLTASVWHLQSAPLTMSQLSIRKDASPIRSARNRIPTRSDQWSSCYDLLFYFTKTSKHTENKGNV